MLLSSPRQIRAARALKDWSQQTLAEHCGLTRLTIVNIESGNQVPGVKTLQKIIDAFDLADIEFTANEGVRKKKDSIRIFRGKKEFKEFFDFMYSCVEKDGGPVYVSNVSNRLFVEWYPNFFESDYVKKMTAIRDKLDFRVLTKEGNPNFPLKDKYAIYRWLPEEHFTSVPFEVFGDYLAIFLLTLDEPIVFVLKGKAAADLYRKKFLVQWDSAIIPPEMEKKTKQNKSGKAV